MTDNCNDTTKFHPKIENVVRASPSHTNSHHFILFDMSKNRGKTSEIRQIGRVKENAWKIPRLH